MRSGFFSGFFWGSVLALAVLLSVSLSLPLDLVTIGAKEGAPGAPIAESSSAETTAEAPTAEAAGGEAGEGAKAPGIATEAATEASPEAETAPEASPEAMGTAPEVTPAAPEVTESETAASGNVPAEGTTVTAPGAVALPEVPAGSEFRRARDDTSPSAPRIEPSIRTAEPSAPATESAAAEAPPAADTAPPEMPRLATTEPQRPGTPPSAEGESAPRIAAAPAARGGTASGRVPPGAIGLPVPDVAAPGAGGSASRLPQIETAPTAPAAPATGEGTEVAESPAEAAPLPTTEEGTAPAPAPEEGTNIMEELDLGALSANSVPFENPEAKPLMAVVLLDLGPKGIDTEVLKTFAFPVTFAIDPEAPGAVERAVELRAAGFEVVAVASGLMGLKGGGTPLEVDTITRDELARLTPAVAVMEPAAGVIQGNIARAEALVGVLAETGHGLLLFDKGLNSGLQMAARSGVPAVTIYRVLDGQNEKAATIQRYLDRAAFKAGQDGQVVVLGRTRAETVKALFAWALGGRAQTVAFAPLSAVLMAQ